MNKQNQKRNSYNTSVINYLEKKYGISKTYIRQSINGSKKGVTCDILKKEYIKQNEAVNLALKNILSEDA